jgi:hypothetical protein
MSNEPKDNVVRGVNFGKPKTVESGKTTEANLNKVGKIDSIRRGDVGQISAGEFKLSDGTLDLLMGLMTGLSKEFSDIYNSAKNSNPLPIKIAEQEREYSTWTKEDLQDFANNPRNYPIFQTRPAMVVAIYNILSRF